MRTVVREANQNMGVYAAVETPGEVKLGDEVEILPEAALRRTPWRTTKGSPGRGGRLTKVRGQTPCKSRRRGGGGGCLRGSRSRRARRSRGAARRAPAGARRRARRGRRRRPAGGTPRAAATRRAPRGSSRRSSTWSPALVPRTRARPPSSRSTASSSARRRAPWRTRARRMWRSRCPSRDEVREGELLEARRAGVGDRLRVVEGAHERRRRHQPADAQRREQQLRRRAGVDHAAVAVERLEALDRPALVAELAVVVVLEHERAAPRAPTRGARGAAGSESTPPAG